MNLARLAAINAKNGVGRSSSRDGLAGDEVVKKGAALRQLFDSGQTAQPRGPVRLSLDVFALSLRMM